MERIRFVVTGRVQGVAFRAHTEREAQRLGLVGFVRNRADGAVEGEAQGDAEVLEPFVQWLGEGPRWARIDRVETIPVPVVGDESRFDVRW